MRVLVLGGYGLIGLSVVRRLVGAGHTVTGLGRSTARVRRAHPDVTWIEADIACLTEARHWRPILSGIDAVINCAGALQDGSRDNLAALTRGMKALFKACEANVASVANVASEASVACGAASVGRVVQISAAGVGPEASTPFLRTKADADAALAGSSLSWIILRPGLVIAPAAYGGTALLRAAASCPFILPVPAGTRAIQTVAVDEVAQAVLMSLEGTVPDRRAYDLVEGSPHGLAEIVLAFSSWLGRPAMRIWILPAWVEFLASATGDALGFLGWRPPLRTTALRQLRDGVTGDPGDWARATGQQPRGLVETLREYPASVQERWFGRLWLLKPIIVGTLALFWLASGSIGFIRQDDAISILTESGFRSGPARIAVTAGNVVDIALGTAILFRRSHHAAALGMVAVSAVYLLAASLAAPDLWLDPLGPLVKVLPAALLALVALSLADER